MKIELTYTPHLLVKDFVLRPGDEWEPRLPGWSLIQIESGTGFWLGERSNQELPTGAVIVVAQRVRGAIRASQLSGMAAHFFNVQPDRLTGLITLNEQRFLEAAALGEDFSLKILPPHSPVAISMRNLRAGRDKRGAAFRLQQLQLFVEIFGDELKQEVSMSEPASDAKERLWEFLKQTPASELLHIGFSDLVQRTRCTPRHFSRVFHEVVGMSFRNKHAELRLARACELLATTEYKVVDIALESGYQSLSLFNLMFTRRFGISPGKWRQKHQNGRLSAARSRRKSSLPAFLMTRSHRAAS